MKTRERLGYKLRKSDFRLWKFKGLCDWMDRASLDCVEGNVSFEELIPNALILSAYNGAVYGLPIMVGLETLSRLR